MQLPLRDCARLVARVVGRLSGFMIVEDVVSGRRTHRGACIACCGLGRAFRKDALGSLEVLEKAALDSVQTAASESKAP